MGNYFVKTVKPNIDVSCATAYADKDILFDWHAFELPKGASNLIGITTLLKGTNGADGNQHDFDLLFAKGNDSGAPISLGTVNAGVTGETCLANGTVINATGGCAATYRPADAMTRAEMASMVTAILGHTNARPAGVTMQSLESLATAGAKNIRISVRNADFTPDANTIVDVMRHTDTVASALDNTAYHALTGLCDAAIVVGTGTECAIDAADAVTNLLGNAAGPSAGHAASQTIEWTAWTGTAGAVYVNDTL